MASKFTTVDEYLDTFTGLTRTRLDEMRALVRSTLPDAEEGLSYNIPAYRLRNEWMTYFSGFAKHVSFTLGGPLGDVTEVFADDLKPYKSSVSAIQFPHSAPLPEDLIRRIIQHRRAGLEAKS